MSWSKSWDDSIPKAGSWRGWTGGLVGMARAERARKAVVRSSVMLVMV